MSSPKKPKPKFLPDGRKDDSFFKDSVEPTVGELDIWGAVSRYKEKKKAQRKAQKARARARAREARMMKKPAASGKVLKKPAASA